MNYSWGNNPYASGFVYFNTNPNIPYQNVQASDFLSFNNSPTIGVSDYNGFSPVHCSSPSNFQKSPRNFYGRHAGRNSFRYHINRDNDSFSSPNTSFNSFSRNNSNKSGYQHKKDNSLNSTGQGYTSKFFDYTCTKDPWAELERELKEKQGAEIEPESSVVAAKEHTEASSTDEQDSDSETKASSSDADEGRT